MAEFLRGIVIRARPVVACAAMSEAGNENGRGAATLAPGRIRHVIWDWNGTLVDDADACVEALNRIGKPRGMPAVTPGEYRRLFGFPVRAYYERLGFDFTVEDWDSVSREYHRHYRETSRASPLRSDAVPALDALRAAGIAMSVLSAAEIGILERMIGERGIRGYFARLAGLSDLYAHSKLDIGRDLVRGSGIAAAATLVVGDTTHDHEVAAELGCACALVAGGHQSEERLRRCGCLVVGNLSDLVRRLVP